MTEVNDTKETNNPPLLRSAELKPDSLSALQAEGIDPSKIENAVQLEADVLLLKYMREESLGIQDQLKTFFNYDSILDSPFFAEENMLIPAEVRF